MHLQCTMSSIFDWEVRRLGMRHTLKHGTIMISGFGYFHKNCRFLWEKNVSKTNSLYLYIRHITNISDFVWFQRSCGSMKSVSSFSSIDVLCPWPLSRERSLILPHLLWHGGSVFAVSFEGPLHFVAMSNPVTWDEGVNF